MFTRALVDDPLSACWSVELSHADLDASTACIRAYALSGFDAKLLCPPVRVLEFSSSTICRGACTRHFHESPRHGSDVAVGGGFRRRTNNLRHGAGVPPTRH